MHIISKSVLMLCTKNLSKLVYACRNYSLYFYRTTRMHSADYAVARCLSVRPSVTGRY